MVKRIVIGDVHGCYHTLMKLIRKFPKGAELIFLGDLCNRGKYSKEVIEYIIKKKHTCIMGNHEEIISKYLKKTVIGNDTDNPWCKNLAWGSEATIKSYKNSNNPKKTIKKHLKWISSLPVYIELKNNNNKKIFLTHGFGLPYYKRKDKKVFQVALKSNRINVKNYKKDWEDFSNYKVVNIFGHCSFKNILYGKNYIGIDTSCVAGNKLSAIDIDTFYVYEQKLDIRDIKD